MTVALSFSINIIGWNTKADGTGKAFSDMAGVFNLATPGTSVTLYAQWKGNPYTIQYDHNDGNGVQNYTTTVQPDKAVSFSSVSSRTGYSFVEWNTKPDGSGASYSAGKYYYNVAEPGKTIVLYAQWKALQPYVIRFHSNNGSGLTSSQESFDYYITFQKNVFSRSGYAFAGWNTKADGSGQSYADGQWIAFFNASDANKENRTLDLYAQWGVSNPYTVYFDANGGTGTMAPQRIDYTGTLNTCAFTRDGHVLSVWCSDPNGGYAEGTIRVYAPFSVLNLAEPGGSITLYAIWTKASPYTVNFNANGGTGSTPSQRIDYSDVLNKNEFSRAGYAFAGWNTKADGTGTSYSDRAVVTALSSGGYVNLYAQWKELPYTVAFNANGGSGTMASQSILSDVWDALSQNTFTRGGYVFAGWNTVANGTGTSYGDGARVRNIAAVGATLTLYAQWRVSDPYTVRFDANGGTGTMTPQSINYTGKLKANAFTRLGYEFAGWNTAANGTGTSYADGASVVDLALPGNTRSLFAQWRKLAPYYVFYDANGGSGTMATHAIDVEVTDKLKTNVFRKANYVFAGWNTASNGTGTSYADGATVRNLAASNASITLYAQWKANPYRVYYNANGGIGTMAYQTMDVDVASKLSAATFTRTSYAFSGWNTKADGSGTAYANGASVRNVTGYQPGGSVTLYAQWRKLAPYKVTFSANGGSGSMATQSIEVDVATPLNTLGFTRTGYTFTGWNTAANGTGTPYAAGVRVTNLAASGGTRILYAQWKANPFTVKFSANGGSGTMTDQSIAYSVATKLKTNTFSRSGYTFTGWNTVSNGSGYSFSNGQSVTNPASVKPGASVTLYAQWKANPYTVKFTANGGSGSMSDQSISYDVTTKLKTNAFSRSGHTFAGWKNAATGTTYANAASVKNLTSPGGTVTLTAQWTKNATSTTTIKYPSDMNTEERDLANQIFIEYNKYRVSKGLQSLQRNWWDSCEERAYKCAFHCASLESNTGAVTLEHAKYWWPGGVDAMRIPDFPQTNYWADILQWSSWKMSAADIVQRWIDSTGHRKSMQCDSAVGAAVACYNNGGTWYYAIVYCFTGNSSQSGS